MKILRKKQPVLSTDREEFDKLMTTLCSAFNTPPTQARKDAYWRAFSKQSLLQFTRQVDLALEDESLTDIPTVSQLRRLKRSGSAIAQQSQPIDTRDHLEHYANRLLLRHLMTRGGLGSTAKFEAGQLLHVKQSDELLACREAVRSLVRWFLEPVREGDELATPQYFIGQFIKAISAVSRIEPEALKAWAEQCEQAASQVPFPKWMARPLSDAPEQMALTA